jgi:hypothetical protein
MKEGGGTRIVDIEKTANKEEIIKIAKGLFFPDGKSSFGNVSEMKLDLFNFKKEKVCSMPMEGENVPFTLGLYIDHFKLSKVRLYLSTMQEENNTDSDHDSDHDSEFSDSVFEQSPFDDLMVQPPEFAHTITDPQSSKSNTQDILIGTSKEREKLKTLIEKAYEESLLADQARSSEMPDNLDGVCEQVDDSADELRNTGAGRLPEELNVYDPHYIVSVRHLSLGVVTCLFALTDLMFSVYDWVGSLHSSPKYFQLFKYSGGCVSPQESISCADKCMLTMVECDHPVVFSSDEEDVIPKGFGPLLSSSFIDNAISMDPISTECPAVIMVDDDKDEMKSNGNSTE